MQFGSYFCCSVCKFQIPIAKFSFSSCTWTIRKRFDTLSSFLFLFSVLFTLNCFSADCKFYSHVREYMRACVCVCRFATIWQYRRRSQSGNGKIWRAIYRFAKWQKHLMNVSFSQSTDSRSKASDDVYLNLDFSTRIRIQIQIGTARWCPIESCTCHSWVNIIVPTHTHRHTHTHSHCSGRHQKSPSQSHSRVKWVSDRVLWVD